MQRRSDENADLTSAAGMREISLAVVGGWEPDGAAVNDIKFYDLSPGKHLPPFRTGWLSYVGPRYASHVVPPPEAVAEPVAGGGLLMLATHEPFDLSNPSHVAAADAIQRALEPIQAMAAQRQPR